MDVNTKENKEKCVSRHKGTGAYSLQGESAGRPSGCQVPVHDTGDRTDGTEMVPCT